MVICTSIVRIKGKGVLNVLHGAGVVPKIIIRIASTEVGKGIFRAKSDYTFKILNSLRGIAKFCMK
jgi:hypothetical protein